MEKGADNLNRLPALSETPKNNTGGRRTATLEHDPDPEGRPARAATAWCEHMSSSLISLCRSCAQNASGSHLHLLRVGTQLRLAPKRRHRTDEKMEKGRRHQAAVGLFGETPENNKRRRYAGRRTVFPSVRTDPPESTPLTPLCDGCCFPLDSLCTRGPTNAIHSHFEM